MSIRRRRQVSSILHEEISEIIQREMKDPRLGFITVTRVEVSPDISNARVLVSVYGSDEEQRDALAALDHARGYIRKLLAPRLSLRAIPQLQFQLDQSMEHAETISRLLDEVREETGGPEDGNDTNRGTS